MKRSKPRTNSGQVSTSGNREMIKYRSPRDGLMMGNGPVPPHAYSGKPENHPAKVAGAPCASPRASRRGRQVDNTRLA